MSSNGVTIKHLFKVAGKKGDSLGSAEACLYFDGKNAVAACPEATVSIDCPQEISTPMLISIKDIKTAMLAAPTLSFTEDADGRVRINGVRVAHVPALGVVPPQTAEILDLDKRIWRPVVRPFRLDGGRLTQVTGALPVNDVRYYLNGIFLDFATGGLVATDGYRINLIEDAVPVVDMPEGRLPGVILPTVMADILSVVGGVQDVFVMERQTAETFTVEGQPPIKEDGYQRVICVAASGAKFRIREVAAREWAPYRNLFDQSRDHPIKAVLDARGREDILAVASVAGANENYPVVTISGEGRVLTVSHADRISRDLSMSQQVGAPFAVNVDASFLSSAIRSAGFYNAAIRMCFSREQGKCITVSSQDFHSLVMPRTEKDESGTDAENEGVAQLVGTET